VLFSWHAADNGRACDVPVRFPGSYHTLPSWWKSPPLGRTHLITWLMEQRAAWRPLLRQSVRGWAREWTERLPVFNVYNVGTRTTPVRSSAMSADRQCQRLALRVVNLMMVMHSSVMPVEVGFQVKNSWFPATQRISRALCTPL